MSVSNIIALSSLIMMIQGVSSFVQPIPFVGSSARTNTRVASSTKENDDFSAFAQSLEEDEEFFTTAPTDNNNQQGTTITWQAKLESFLDPRTSLAKRQILASELAASNEDIRDSVLMAVKDRKIDSLLTPTQKKLQDGTRAVARQLTNDILPKALENNPISSAANGDSSPPPPEEVLNALPKIGNRLFRTFQSQAQKQFQEFQDDLSDPFNKIPQRISQQSQFVQNEVQNVFSETPSGLKEPSYTVVRETEEYEIRDYESYTVASTPISSDDSGASFSLDDNIATGGSAFNTLASYLFGGNSEERTMEMTTPVTTTSLGEMRFYLSGSSFPEPKISQDEGSVATTDSTNNEISLLKIPASRLAVRRFTGFVTDGEVSRQKQILLSNLELDGEELDVKHGAVVPHVIFQYNPPYTLPVIRRNEIGIPLVIPSDSSLFLDNSNEMNGLSTSSADEEEEIKEDDDGDGYDEDGSPSDIEV